MGWGWEQKDKLCRCVAVSVRYLYYYGWWGGVGIEELCRCVVAMIWTRRRCDDLGGGVGLGTEHNAKHIELAREDSKKSRLFIIYAQRGSAML